MGTKKKKKTCHPTKLRKTSKGLIQMKLWCFVGGKLNTEIKIIESNKLMRRPDFHPKKIEKLMFRVFHSPSSGQIEDLWVA